MDNNVKNYSHIKLIIVLMFCITAGLINILSYRVLFVHEKITFLRYPVIYCVLFLMPGLTVGLIAIFYRYWHAKGGNPLSYPRALFDVSLASAPVLLYLVFEIIPGSKSVIEDVFSLLSTPAEILYLLYRGATGTIGQSLNSLGNLAIRVFVLVTSLTVLTFRSKKLSFILVLAIIANTYLAAILLGFLQIMMVGALD
ncbi:hypothetical protein Tph_c20710 [Thermacetogenium phaeum DSM 12270]|uniref:Yip1 domain-containing protein n=1 Tax=Thermacetogenium phaeum (strain ATCC BAA-254 / DSM 26808 / PB) TaxID=1089553 RepID=K4LJY0_THEPS|nr:hypothetical protein [Thermacetogenium phaeum]AFV12265.1 hypothetical protein Tph_c20710 [Thermacetogenium phaeum DSM 12270]